MAMQLKHLKAKQKPVNVAGEMIGPGKSVRGTTAPEMTVQGKIAATGRAIATAMTAGVMTAHGKIVRPAKIAATALGMIVLAMSAPGMIGPEMIGPEMIGLEMTVLEMTGRETKDPGKNAPGMTALARTARPGKTGRGVIALKAVAGIAGGNANPVRTALSATPLP